MQGLGLEILSKWLNIIIEYYYSVMIYETNNL